MELLKHSFISINNLSFCIAFLVILTWLMFMEVIYLSLQLYTVGILYSVLLLLCNYYI